MKKIMVAMLFSILAVSHGFGEAPKVGEFKGSDGWYSQWHKKINIIYSVDTKSEQCFVESSFEQGIALSPIPCSKLKKRDEWKKIITWDE